LDSVFPLTDPSELPAVTELIRGRPPRWIGLPVDWSEAGDPEPVFVSRFSGTKDDHHIFLFGTRYDLADALVGGQSLAPGYFVEYFVIDSRSPQELHRLTQSGGITYSETEEKGDYIPARELADVSTLSLAEPPRWAHRSEAHWPTANGRPMLFVGQVALPENPTTVEKLTWNETLHLFCLAESDTHRTFKIVAQDPAAQSAEDHYADEVRRWASE
jgi:hypothetical protein